MYKKLFVISNALTIVYILFRSQNIGR